MPAAPVLPSLASQRLNPSVGTPPARCCYLGCRDLLTRSGSRSFPAASASRTFVDEATMTETELNQFIREGHYENNLVDRQANKTDDEQPSISSVLPPWDITKRADVAVVGCGPAGLSLAAHLGSKGLNVALVGADSHFVNNYGVWYDEFEDLGLGHTIDKVWDGAISYFGENGKVKVDRKYGRVCRRALRAYLLEACLEAGVSFQKAFVEDIDVSPCKTTSTLRCRGGDEVTARLVTVASGAASGKFLKFESDAPAVGSQTAYGIEAEVEGYEDQFPKDLMVFMDYRRHHTGLWDATAKKLENGPHPNADDHLWGAKEEVPSFLYTMPLENGRVFLEETCLVAKPALPFAVLKRRLERRLRALGIKVNRIVEEEWSYIPVGGPLPLGTQPITAFGAAANLIHPATGYSIARSLRAAPELADSIALALQNHNTVLGASRDVWEALWPAEMRRRAAFHIFGMELLAQLNLDGLCMFFLTFFKLPNKAWHGFMASTLTSVELLGFASLTFILAPPYIKARLIGHIFLDDSGLYLFSSYIGQSESQQPQLPEAIEESKLPSLNS